MQESKALYPLLNVDDVYGTLYSPGDGTVTPEVCTGLARAAVRAGAVVAEGRRVKEIRQERKADICESNRKKDLPISHVRI